MNTFREPICQTCNTLLIQNSTTSNWIFYKCPTCNLGDAELIGDWLPTDDDTNFLFYQVALKLNYKYGILIELSIDIAKEYYTKFTDESYCNFLGIPVQDDDFFHHEYVDEICQRIKYFIIENYNGNNSDYLLWCKKNK